MYIYFPFLLKPLSTGLIYTGKGTSIKHRRTVQL